MNGTTFPTISASENYFDRYRDAFTDRYGEGAARQFRPDESSWQAQENKALKSLRDEIRQHTSNGPLGFFNRERVNPNEAILNGFSPELRRIDQEARKNVTSALSLARGLNNSNVKPVAEALNRAALNLIAEGNNPQVQNSFIAAVKAFAGQQQGNINNPYIANLLQQMGGIVEEGKITFPKGVNLINAHNAVDILENLKSNPTRLLEDAARFKWNPQRQAFNDGNLKYAMSQGGYTQGPWSWLKSRIPFLNNLGMSESSRSVVSAAQAGLVNASNAAASNLGQSRNISDFLHIATDNLKQNSGAVTSTVRAGLRANILNPAQALMEGGLKGVLRLPALAAMTVAAPVIGKIASMDNPIGHFTRFAADWVYAPGAGENLAKGNWVGFGGNMAEHGLLTIGTMGLSAAGLTGLMTTGIVSGLAGLGIACPPLAAGLLAGAVAFGGLSLAWSGIKNVASWAVSPHTNDKNEQTQTAQAPTATQAPASLPPANGNSLLQETHDLMKQIDGAGVGA
jgi:hypothetical protein